MAGRRPAAPPGAAPRRAARADAARSAPAAARNQTGLCASPTPRTRPEPRSGRAHAVRTNHPFLQQVPPGGLFARRIGVPAVDPDRRQQQARIIPYQHLGRLALLTELVGGVDRKQLRLALALVGAEPFTGEGDEPDVLLPRHLI